MTGGNDCCCAAQGFLQIPISGTYVFTLTSTDGSRLLLSPTPGDALVIIDNDGELSLQVCRSCECETLMLIFGSALHLISFGALAAAWLLCRFMKARRYVVV